METVDSNKTDINIEMEAFQKIVAELKDLSTESQKKVLQMVFTLLDIDYQTQQPSLQKSDSTQQLEPSLGIPSFSEDRSMSPKEFLFQKQPKTDIERVACLAFYLTHYRDTPFFKTFDISKMNTEAAQIKLSNPTVAVDNATRAGYLVPAIKGQKQLSAIGEVFVSSLPDRELAKDAVKNLKPKRKSKSSSKNKNKEE